MRQILFILFLSFLSCKKETNVPCPNQKTVYFFSEFVCGEGGAAAVSFTEFGIEGITINNFSDFLNHADLSTGDKLLISYDESAIDSSVFLSGILCGPLIVLPTVNADCLEIE